MPSITIKLGGPLRQKVAGHVNGEMTLDLPEGAMVSHALEALGLGGDLVRVLILNGRPLAEDRVMAEGDRLALFPRELAFNMYVATNFFNPLARKALQEKKES